MGGFSSKPCLITRGYSNSGLWQQFYHSYPYFQVKTSENKWQVMGWVHFLRGTFLGFPADLNWISPCPTCFIAFAAAGLGLWGIHVQTGPCSTYVWEDLISSGHTLNINLILEHGQSSTRSVGEHDWGSPCRQKKKSLFKAEWCFHMSINPTIDGFSRLIRRIAE